MKKKKIIIIILLLIVLVIGSIYFINKHETYTYEWVEVESSSVGQYMLYVNDSKGNHVDGTVRLVYINGKTKRVEVDKEGLLYVKGVVSEVRNPKGR